MEHPTKATKAPYVIGIAGCSGSGKTFFLRSFLRHFASQEVALVSQDDYYIPANTKTKEENRLYNFDVPQAIDRVAFQRDIQLLIDGHTVRREEYTFNNAARKPKVVETEPASILIIEGLFIFHFEEVDAHFDYRIFLDAEEEVALQRRIRRDFIERGYDETDVRYKWVNHVIPAYHQYLLPYRAQCHRIVINDTDDPTPIAAIADELSASLRSLPHYGTDNLPNL